MRGHDLFAGTSATAHAVPCRACRHQVSPTAGTLIKDTKLLLSTWFLVIHLISEAKTGLSSLALKRDLGMSYPTAWLIHQNVMAERETSYVLDGQIQVDDAYLGGERSGGKVGREPENKVPFVDSVSLNEDGLLRCRHHGRLHDQPSVVAGRRPQDVPEINRINTALGNLNTSLSGTYHTFGFQAYAARYLAAFLYRFNRRFDPRALPTRLLMAAVRCKPKPQRAIPSTELYC